MGVANETYHAPLAADSPVDNGGAIVIVNLVALIVSLWSVALRIYISNRKRGGSYKPYRDDWLCYASTLICLIIFALTWTSVSHGNGKIIDLISPSNLVIVQKLQYAIEILYIVAIYFSRASTILLIERLQSATWSILWKIFIATLTVWAVISIFIVALKCDLHNPWIEYNVGCKGLAARWIAIEVSGIVIEGCILAFLISIIYTVSMPIRSKLKVIILFGTRITVVIFAGLRLSSLHSYYSSSDPTHAGTLANIYLLAEMNASLITATTPLLKAFILEFKIVGNQSVVLIPSRQNPDTNASKENGSGNHHYENGAELRIDDILPERSSKSDQEMGVAH